MFEINQGRSATFDVLANDIDGPNGGLTIVSSSQSPNATITIVDNMIDYRPDFGFFGTDTFFYTVEDANGSQDTANVVVEVIRFSDLNNNMLNDFVECDCTDLTLQTGVHGSGVGRFSAFMLLMLFGGVFVRQSLTSRSVDVAQTSGAGI